MSLSPGLTAVAPVCSSRSNPACDITVLKAHEFLVNKRFYLDPEGQLQTEAYQQALLFDVVSRPASCIDDLYAIVQCYSSDANHILIRGLPANGVGHRRVRRKQESFPEHVQGTPWVMLDFDDIALPAGMDPLSLQAIEWVIAKLPSEFNNVSYVYQHSGSAGILKADGNPKKAGLNAHVFFWLNRRVLGPDLTAYLSLHCLRTGFYEVGENGGGVAAVRYGIDPAPIRSSNQAHYIASPTIEAGVRTWLNEGERLALCRKSSNEVVLPPIAPDVKATAWQLHHKVRTEYQVAHGAVLRRTEVQTATGVSSVAYYARPGQSKGLGRKFLNGELRTDRFFRLYFSDEGSPGSWYVDKRDPQIARRFGDYETIALKELSEGAYVFVRDQLQWFVEIPHQALQLMDAGYLPELSSFAQAKTSLVLAPTGSGKTRATMRWIQEKIQDLSCVIYTAPTIALVSQMEADLRGAGFGVTNYRDVARFGINPGAVVVTTNESLLRMLNSFSLRSFGYYLVVDEVHAALDSFMRSNRKSEVLASALAKAKQTLLLTGTLTNLQRAYLPDVVRHALGALTAAHYCCYEFHPLKQNPLYVLETGRYDSDLADLLQSLSGKHMDGEMLPRTVLLLPTSKLEMYRHMLSDLGLEQVSEVVSRPESSEAAIERARTSNRPILVSSPLFALGLNFEREPVMLWCRFDHIQADTNQIIQTVNRANRGPTQCEVRIYGNVDPNVEFRHSSIEHIRSETHSQFTEEASIAGQLEQHLQIDRVAYLKLREAEKNSYVSLSVLVKSDAIQNYHIVPAENLPSTSKEKALTSKSYRANAKQAYDDAVMEQATRYGAGEPGFYLDMLGRLESERLENFKQVEPRIERELENERLGLVMGLCCLSSPSAARKVILSKVRRLHGELTPWTSAQYDRETFAKWAAIEAEKSEHVLVLLQKLRELQTGAIDAERLVASLSRNRKLGAAFLALTGSDVEYTNLVKILDNHRKDCASLRKLGGDSCRVKVKESGFKLLRGLLEPLGVCYGTKLVRGRQVTDVTQPVVAANWSLIGMADELRRQIARLKALPLDQKVPMETSDKYSGEPDVCRKLCEDCVLFHQNSCAVGHPVDWLGDGWVGHIATKCSHFKGIRVTAVQKL